MNKLRSALLSASIPVQKVISRFKLPEPICSGTDYRMIDLYAKPGDVLLSQEYGHLSRWFIPGEWDHAALYLGGGSVIEALPFDGVITTDLIDWVLKKDRIAVLRPLKKNGETFNFEDGKAIDETAGHYIGFPYDHLFSDTNEAFYCSELVLDVLGELWRDDFTKRDTFGEMTVTPQDFFNAVGSGKLKTIYVSKG